jgi:hypothetical protein
MPVMKAYQATLVASVPVLGPVGIGLLLSLLAAIAFWRLRPETGW